MKKIVAIMLTAAMVFSLAACAAPETAPAATEAATEAAKETEAATEAAKETEAAPVEEAKVNPNEADFVYFDDQNWEINSYYNTIDPELNSNVTYTGTAGIVNVPDVPTTEMPDGSGYTIGFSVYYTVDEVGAMLLKTMQDYADKMGVKLLVNDANYDQLAQNSAIEQWIVEGVDGIIVGPCDFYGVEQGLLAAKEAGIPVVTLNPALAGEALTAVMSECTEQGAMAAQLLIDHLKSTGSDMKGVVLCQTLPTVHPNAATRAKGFKDAFKEFPDIEVVDLTGVSPEDHYTAFEGAIGNYGDKLIGGFGLYSSATVGMINANEANSAGIPITSIDNDKFILEAIYNDKCLGSCCYSSTAPAIWCLSDLVNYLNGLEVPSIMFYANNNVTKDNVEAMFEHYYDGKTLADYMAGNQ